MKHALPKPMELSAAKQQLLQQRLIGITARDSIEPRAAGARTPISEEQHRIWLHAAMEPDLPIYNEPITVHRRGSFDLAVLDASFNEILKRHEAWRTSFAMVDGELLQVVHPELRVTLSLTDLMLPDLTQADLGARTAAEQDARREAEACRLATEDARLPFDLHHAPLFRASVLRLAPDHHCLQLTLHHIIFDGVSLYRIFLPELAAIYAAFTAGEPSPLAAPGLQYGDYAAWRATHQQTPERSRHLEYWRKELAGELPTLRLPVDRPRPARSSHRGAQLAFTMPEDLMVALRALSRSQGVTLYVTLLAALKTLFLRYSGQQDVIVGGLADGRRRPELQNLMGYFLDTYAIRTRPSPELPFSEYLSQVLHSVLSALDAAEVPFSRVVEAVEPTRDRSHHPIFQTFLALQPPADTLPDGWDMHKTAIHVEVAKFDLHIEVDERRDRTEVRFMYSTDLFDAATIERMAGHWTTLLTAVTCDPDCALGDLPVLTAPERELMLVTWNRQEMPFPQTTLHDLVKAQALRTPAATAVNFEQESLTYAELERHAEHLAAQLRRAGSARGGLVAVCLGRSHFLPVALLGILKTGAAYLPLDPGTPRARRLLCLEDAAPAVILTQRSLLDDLPPSAATVLLLEDAMAATCVGSAFPLRDVERGEDPMGFDEAAYVIHTSGSTGRPKAVEISHRAVVNLLTSMQREPGFTAADTLLAITTISFDIAGLELFLPMITGGRVVIASREVALDPYLLAPAIKHSACTVLQATPSTWRSLLSSGWQPAAGGLRVLCGGEALTRDLAQGLLALGLEVWNVYGPTETTIWSTVQRVTDGAQPIAVGRPIANTTTYILDARQQPVPIGVAGELYIGGAGLANRYRGQPVLTGERFVRPAIASNSLKSIALPDLADGNSVDVGRGWDESLLYRTGDYALYRSDGRIEIQGRADNQVKIRGYRIELEDVESALAAHPDVSAAAARAWPDASGGHRLSAYLVGRHGSPPDAHELRLFLSTRVPDYMVPSDVVALDALPLTANGKMDRNALPKPMFDAGAATKSTVLSPPPSTPEECRLAPIWAALLNRGAIGVNDNFFDLGGHSLLVARLQQRIVAEFGQQISMAAIFHAPTIALQAALIEQLALPRTAGDRSRLIPIQPRGSKPALFWIEPPPLISNLAVALGSDQPFLGVTMTGADLDALAASGHEPSLEDFARLHAEIILKHQPQGPYTLGGLCTGGILAYGVAAYLRMAGHSVASLVLLDAENPVYYRRLDTVAVEVAKLRFYARRAFHRGEWEMFLRHLRSRLRRLLRLDKPATTEMSAIESAIVAAAFQYKPPAYDSDVLLILPRERPEVVDYLSGWKVVVNGTLACRDVNGHHDELLNPEYAAGVAETIAAHLEECRNARRPLT